MYCGRSNGHLGGWAQHKADEIVEYVTVRCWPPSQCSSQHAGHIHNQVVWDLQRLFKFCISLVRNKLCQAVPHLGRRSKHHPHRSCIHIDTVGVQGLTASAGVASKKV